MRSSRNRPALSQELIFLDRDDDLGTVRAKLESAGADQVFLAVPRRAGVLRTPLEFRILARLAHEIASETVIVTDDGDRRRMAREEGFRTRRSLRSVNHLMRPSGSRFWLPALPELPLPSIGALLVLVVLLGVAAALNFYVLPVMTVTLTPSTRVLEREFTLVVDPQVTEMDFQNATIPGRLVDTTFQVTRSAATGSSRPVGRDRAKGEASFSNNSGVNITLPAGTVVISTNQQRFTTDSELAVRASARNVTVGITAIEPGSAANVKVGEITAADGSVPSAIVVTNTKPTSGGSDREAQVVGAEDIAALRRQMLESAIEQAVAKLQTAVGEGRTVIPKTVQIEVASEEFNPGVGGEGDNLSGRLAVQASGVAFDDQEYLDLLNSLALGEVSPDAEMGEDGPTIGAPVEALEGGVAKLRVPVTATTVRRIDTETVAEALQGKSLAQARTVLQEVEGLAEPPEVDIWPSWATRAYRVQVEVATP